MRPSSSDPLAEDFTLPVQVAPAWEHDAQTPLVLKDGTLTLTASINKTITEGRPAILTVAFHNDKATVSWAGESGFNPYSLSISVGKGPAGRVSRTAVGDRILTPPRFSFHFVMETINPGETRSYHYNLARMFDLSRAGNYSVSFSRDISPDFRFPTASTRPLFPTGPMDYSLDFTMTDDTDSISGPTALMPPLDHSTGIAPTPVHWGPTVGGIAMSASLPGDVLPTTRPVVIAVVLKNTTSQPVELGTLGADMASFQLAIMGPKRQAPISRSGPEQADVPIPLLSAGDDLLLAPANDTASLVLPPGGERQYRFVLSRLADFSVAGLYTIQVSRTLPDKGTVAAPLQQMLLDGPFDGVAAASRESMFTIE